MMIQLNGWQKQTLLRFFVAFLLGISCVLLSGEIQPVGILSGLRSDSAYHQVGGAIAQFIDPQEVAPIIYEHIPDFPKGNDYTNLEAEDVGVNNTLVERFIRYHLYVKSRPPQYRLDWKITIADYLGIHSPMRETQYPGAGQFTQNPMDDDVAIVRSLNRRQRNELVNVLAGIFNPNTAKPSAQTRPTPAPQAQPQPQETFPRRPALPQPGAADLLKF